RDYTIFGKMYNKNDIFIKSLQSQNIQDLLEGEDVDIKKKLKIILSSILFNFTDLIGILVDNPTHEMRVRKLNDLHILFINMHHVINLFRPHQAIETLKHSMKRKISENMTKTEQLKQLVEKYKCELEEMKSSNYEK
ncbi:MAG: Mediator of RNA polymerase II transcription subunit 7, partial [Paramarteilia canceri]